MLNLKQYTVSESGTCRLLIIYFCFCNIKNSYHVANARGYFEIYYLRTIFAAVCICVSGSSWDPQATSVRAFCNDSVQLSPPHAFIYTI
jgi:hypothetical protein